MDPFAKLTPLFSWQITPWNTKEHRSHLAVHRHHSSVLHGLTVCPKNRGVGFGKRAIFLLLLELKIASLVISFSYFTVLVAKDVIRLEGMIDGPIVRNYAFDMFCERQDANRFQILRKVFFELTLFSSKTEDLSLRTGLLIMHLFKHYIYPLCHQPVGWVADSGLCPCASHLSLWERQIGPGCPLLDTEDCYLF